MRGLQLNFTSLLFALAWMTVLTEKIKSEEVDFSKLEFEELEIEENKDSFLKSLDTFEVTYPQAIEMDYKLTENHRRLRRDVSDKRVSHYKVNAFGKIIQLELYTSDSVLPGTVVEYHTDTGIQKKLLSENSCLRVGKVLNMNSSSAAAISDCDGLAGLVRTEDDMFFIEPMRMNASNGNSRQRPHLIYRTKDLPKTALPDTDSRIHLEEPLKAGMVPRISSPLNRHSRTRRDIWDSFITVSNKARRSVQLYWLDLYGKRRYFATIEQNRRKFISTFSQTKWVALDETSQKTLLMNGKDQYVAKRNDESNRDNIVITVPSDLELPPIPKKSVSGDDKWMETMIVADNSVVNFHGKANIEKYLLILSNVINLIMKDATTGVRFNFVLTRLVILQKNEPKLVITRDSASMSVQSACDYAVTLQKSIDDKHKEHHDFALVLTRRDFGPAGYAPVSTICSQTRSCALVDDNGLASAFIAAHEAGHVLGLGHDGEENSCSEDAEKGSVMAAVVLSKLNRFHWSPCSRKLLQESTRFASCLDDRPYPKDFKYLDSLPGVFATMDEQCRFDFGKGYEKCEYYTADGCQRLWCTESRRRYQSCTTRGRPLLDGTYCGKNKWCRRGRCVASSVKSTEPSPIHGNWGSWKQWSKCSLSCGTGVRYRTRACDSPKPAHRGQKCDGAATEHDICNTQNCRITKNYEDIRNDQCKMLFGDEFALYKDSEFSEHFEDSRYSLGCDFEHGWCNWRQDKRDKFDWTRINGRTPSAYTGPNYDPNGSTKGKYAFIEASDNFNARRQRGYQARLLSPTILLPRACLKLNYHMYGEDMGSLKIIMKRKKGEQTLWEKSGNQGNQWRELELSIEQISEYSLVIEGVRGTHYKGDAAIDNLRFEPGLCQKEAEAKNPCVLSCMSKDKANFYLGRTVLDGTRCHNNKSHDICLDEKCEKFGCDMKFNSDKILDECNVCAGDGSTCNAVEGTKNISPKQDYEKILDLDKDTTNFILEDSKSSPYRIGLRVPGSIQEIYMASGKGHGYFAAAGTTLYFSNFGDGRQMIAASGPFKKPLEAVLFSGSNEIRQDSEEVELRFKYFLKKNAKDFYKYEIEKWGRCSKKCGTGHQTASLKCVKNKLIDVPSKFCSHLKKNVITRSCNTMSCQSIYKWVILRWSKCTASCGSGRQRRIVACANRKLNKVVPNRICPPPYPKNTRDCNLHPCVTYRWTIGAWGKCSRSCGGGLQVRIASCLANNDNKAVSASLCKEKEPQKTRECNLHQCDTFEYKITAASRCSKTCGGGLRVKIVYCINKRTGVRVGNTFCIGPSPPRIEKCNTKTCPVYQWKTGNFGPCSQSCDGGMRTRDVYCIEKISSKKVSSDFCNGKKPVASESCENPPCSQYFFDVGKWSKCDAMCGFGSQNRTVKCLMDGSRKEAPAWRCDHLKRPTVEQECRVRACIHPDSLACNFDDGRFCRWENTEDDDFNWLAGRNTPTLTTGPSKDHTSRKGKFAYIESSAPRLSRDRAVLSSPPLRVNRGCFSFWYHMRGAGMGRLFVRIVGAQGYKKQVFERRRHQGDRWIRANIPIPNNTPKGFKIRITGERGTSFLSDIGLDDFKFSEHGCPDTCIEKSPLCVVVLTAYCRYPSYRQLCCATCAKRTSS